ncbi:Baeyer-Villiger monooxygenase [Paramyrothecium foliicola]|nr:Baeyer-Villiger monooxygenase [Paramyrothecium foliicola]
MAMDSILEADIFIVGGGFGGCYALHQLRALGYSVKILEAGSDFGGVWHFNRYPGARVDSEVPVYQFSLPQAWMSFNFRERFPGHEEIRAYVTHLVDVLDLRKDAIFNARVNRCSYDAELNLWTLQTNSGLLAKSRYVVFATGTTNKPYIPSFSGIGSFAGAVIHPAAWPKTLDVSNKRIGIIGQGSSGLQILQSLAKENCELTVFVRNPPMGIPMRQKLVSEEESEQQKDIYDALFSYAKYKHDAGYTYNTCTRSFYETTPEDRRQHYEKLWSKGTFAFLGTNYQELYYDKVVNAEIYQFWAEKARARITDPKKRDIIAPLKQYQWIGAKRPILEMDYFEMIDRSNVKLVDLKSDPIQEFVHDGIVTRGEESTELHALDIVIVATGYDSVTGSLYDMSIMDKNGTILQEKWKDGISTYLGMMIPDMPNAFMLYGPQAPSGLSNGPTFLELQVEWLVGLLKKLSAEDIATIEVPQDIALDYRHKNQQNYANLLMSETQSWWDGSNIPGKTREPLFWVGGLQSWRQESLRSLENWSRFMISQRS